MTTKVYFLLMLQVGGEPAVALFPHARQQPCLGHYYSHDREKKVTSIALRTPSQKSHSQASHISLAKASHIAKLWGGKKNPGQTSSNKGLVDDRH